MDLLPQSLDPHAGTALSDPTFIHPCYDRLTAYADRTSNVVPSLALTWRVSADQQKYTFVLQQGADVFGRAPSGRPKRSDTHLNACWARAGRAGPCFPRSARSRCWGRTRSASPSTAPPRRFLASLAGTPASIVSPGCADHPPGVPGPAHPGQRPVPTGSMVARKRHHIARANRYLRPTSNRPDRRPGPAGPGATGGNADRKGISTWPTPRRPGRSFKTRDRACPWRVREFPALSFYYLALNCKQPPTVNHHGPAGPGPGH